MNLIRLPRPLCWWQIIVSFVLYAILSETLPLPTARSDGWYGWIAQVALFAIVERSLFYLFWWRIKDREQAAKIPRPGQTVASKHQPQRCTEMDGEDRCIKDVGHEYAGDPWHKGCDMAGIWGWRYKWGRKEYR